MKKDDWDAGIILLIVLIVLVGSCVIYGPRWWHCTFDASAAHDIRCAGAWAGGR